jgi:N-acyl-L-homoserine lactone synthetase
MIVIGSQSREPSKEPLLQAMFEARKQVFVDLLKWDVPVLDGRYEIDQFDDEHAEYLIVADPAGHHLGSARLLPTSRPHILDSLFPSLCAGDPPRSADCFEITRFCLGRNQNSRDRLVTRNRLVFALAQYALENGIAIYTGVAELSWLQQILAFGWRCRPLGLPQVIDGRTLGALRIDIDAETPAQLAANGIFSAVSDEEASALAA